MVSHRGGLLLLGLAVLTLALWAGPGAASEPRGIYLVDDFGAVHDGKSDDGPAIRAAIAACSATGGIVQFGPGVYAFRDSLEVVTSSVILRGIGRANPKDFGGNERGTVLDHRPARDAKGPTAVRIGHQAEPVVACGIEDLTLRGSTGATGHLLWMAGVEYCNIERVDLFHNAARERGKAALYVTSIAKGAPSNGCRFLSLHVFVARNEGGEGIGILVACDGPAYTTDLHFLHLKVNNAVPPGRAIEIRGSSSGTNANHSFMSCRIDSPGAGVLVDAPRCRFVSCVIDHPTGDAEVLAFTERAAGCAWSGPVDGSVRNPLANRPDSPRIEP